MQRPAGAVIAESDVMLPSGPGAALGSAHSRPRDQPEFVDAGFELARPPRLRATRIILGVLILAVVVAIVAHLGEARRFSELIRRAQPVWLCVAVALQAGTYLCAGGVWWLVLVRMSSPQPIGVLALLSIGKLFTDQAVPSAGVTGNALMVRGVVRRGTPTPAARTALVIGLLGFYAAMLVATGASLFWLWKRHHASPALVGLTLLLGIVATAVCAVLIALVRGGGSSLHRFLARIGPVQTLFYSFAQVPHRAVRDPASLAGAFGLQLANIVLDAATLQVTLLAVGQCVALGAVFPSLVFASITEMLGVIPGGLGTFEGTCVALLQIQGVAIEPALAATLILRGLTFWLPMLPGMIIVRREIGFQ